MKTPAVVKPNRTTCYCGSRQFKTSITLEISDVPLRLAKHGTLSYDDTAGYSDGWDVGAQPEVACAKCSHLWDLEHVDAPAELDAKGRPQYMLVDKEAKSEDYDGAAA